MSKVDAPLEDENYEAGRAVKNLIQLNWVDITIKAMPATGRCKPQGALKVERTIIDNVSGCVMPG